MRCRCDELGCEAMCQLLKLERNSKVSAWLCSSVSSWHFEATSGRLMNFAGSGGCSVLLGSL